MYEITLSCRCTTLTGEPAAWSVHCTQHGGRQSIRYVEPLSAAV